MSAALFRKPGLFLTWGLKNGDLTPEQLAQRAKDSGFQWLAQEFGDPNTQPSDDLVRRLRAACAVHGLHFGMWEVSPRSLDLFDAVTRIGVMANGQIEPRKPNFWILNVESDHSDYGPLLGQFRAKHSLLPVAVITNCDLVVEPFLRHNVKVMPEAYENDNPQATPENMAARCRSMGWRVVFPCVGVYHDYPLASYSLDGTDGYSVYMAEGMQPRDWLTAYRLNGGG